MKNLAKKQSVHDQPASVKMVPWKQTVVTAGGVYPLLLLYEWLIRQIVPAGVVDIRILMLIIVILVAATMVLLVMPAVIKLTGKWLFNS